MLWSSGVQHWFHWLHSAGNCSEFPCYAWWRWCIHQQSPLSLSCCRESEPFPFLLHSLLRATALCPHIQTWQWPVLMTVLDLGHRKRPDQWSDQLGVTIRETCAVWDTIQGPFQAYLQAMHNTQSRAASKRIDVLIPPFIVCTTKMMSWYRCWVTIGDYRWLSAVCKLHLGATEF